MSESECAWLVTGEGKERTRVPLLERDFRIGRAPQNSLVLAHERVSCRHALIQGTPQEGWSIIDLGSRNGTLLNERRVTVAMTLRDGDEIAIGGTVLRFEAPASQAAADAPAELVPAEFDVTQPGIDQRLVTVVVTDMRDFTGLSQRLGEEVLSRVVSAYFGEADRVLSERGCFGRKFIGDAVMGLWLHRPGVSDAAEIIAALHGLRELSRVTASLAARHGLDEPIRIGGGVNTGMAAVGNMGSSASPDYTALGEPVNRAFRLESATKQVGLDVAFGEATYRALSVDAEAARLFAKREVDLKGYEGPAPAYCLSFAGLDALLAVLGEFA
jgi:adenylate cyclase